jgi:hypothetical protein
LARLPIGTPPGRYPVYLRVYANPPFGDGPRPVGRELPLGYWPVEAGAHWPASELDPTMVGLTHTGEWRAGPDLTLIGHDVGQGDDRPFLPGDRVPLTVLWRGPGPLPPLMVTYGGGRQATVPATPLGRRDGLTREWRSWAIPVDASPSDAALALPDGQVVGRFRVAALPPAVRAPPEVAQDINADLPGVGALVGLSAQPVAAQRGAPLELELVWRAGTAPPLSSYTVFVQLLGPDGRVVCQHDGLPAAGTRPTTSWRPGEVIVDRHRLDVPAGLRAGPVQLIAGLYDASTGQRVATAAGPDHVLVADALPVR